MDNNLLVVLKTSFDEVANAVAESNIEYWMACDLMPLLGYSRWENFVEAIDRAKTACSAQKVAISEHFRDVTKMMPSR